MVDDACRWRYQTWIKGSAHTWDFHDSEVTRYRVAFYVEGVDEASRNWVSDWNKRVTGDGSGMLWTHRLPSWWVIAW